MSKNRSMQAKVMKVRKYDCMQFKRMFGDYCADDYVEGRRTYEPPMDSKPYNYGKIDHSQDYCVWTREGRRYFYKNSIDAVASLTNGSGYRLKTPDGRYYGYKVRVHSNDSDHCVWCHKITELVPCEGFDPRNATYMFIMFSEDIDYQYIK